MGLAFPPVSAVVLGIFAWPLLWHVAKRSLRATYVGLLTWNLIGCYWLTLTALSAPNLREAVVSFAAGALAILTNPLLMLLPFAIWKKWGKGNLLFFIGLWGLFEFLHFRWELTWSWLNLGFMYSAYPDMVRWAHYTGFESLTLWTLLLAALVHKLFFQPQIWHVGALIAVLGIPPIIGCLPTQSTTSTFVSVHVIQPNIDPYVKFHTFPPAQQVRYLESFLHALDVKEGDLILYPETALPLAVIWDSLATDPYVAPFVRFTREKKVNILLGAVVVKYLTHPTPSAERVSAKLWQEAYNAALLLRPDTVQAYAKTHLVPFVERVPYLEYFSFLRTWNIDLGGSFGSFGKPTHQSFLTLYPDDLPIEVAICYESIFFHSLRNRWQKDTAAGLLAILTNDGWWKKSSGYYQHFRYGVLQAMLLGVSVARSANTGISALISSHGHVIQSLPYNHSGHLSGVLRYEKPAYKSLLSTKFVFLLYCLLLTSTVWRPFSFGGWGRGFWR
ncbi:MAG: apolipoprotein N-acyltransferase [Bacteroidia bacterium]